MAVYERLPVLLLGFLIATGANAQPVLELARTFQLDLAVPDAPAFLLLEREEGAALRPSTVRAAAAALADFVGPSGGFTIPEALGVEVSPGLLIGGPDLSVAAYRARPWLYRLRVSLATLRSAEEGTPSALAVGVRVTTVDRADLRTSTAYEAEATELAAAINALILAERQRLGPMVPLETIETMPDVQDARRELIEEFQERWSGRRWNERISELAIAFRASSPDTLLGHLRGDRISGWYSASFPLSSWGLWLVGLAAEGNRSVPADDFRFQGSASTQFFAGSNTRKVFLEGQVALPEGKEMHWFVSGGAELKVVDHIWITFSAGAGRDLLTDETQLRSSFRLGLGI